MLWERWVRHEVCRLLGGIADGKFSRVEMGSEPPGNGLAWLSLHSVREIYRHSVLRFSSISRIKLGTLTMKGERNWNSPSAYIACLWESMGVRETHPEHLHADINTPSHTYQFWTTEGVVMAEAVRHLITFPNCVGQRSHQTLWELQEENIHRCHLALIKLLLLLRLCITVTGHRNSHVQS